MALALLMKIISLIGSPLVYVLAAFYFISDFAFFALLILGLVISIILILIFRTIFRKERPSLNHMKSRYRLSHSKFSMLKQYYHKLAERKFASGHVARITVFAVLTYFYLGIVELSVALLVVAFIVGFARVYLKRHTGADIITGFIIGLASGYAAWILLPFVQQFL